MTEAFDAVVSRLQRHQGVRGVMLVGMEDGTVIAGDAGTSLDSDTAAALAASMFRRTRAAAGGEEFLLLASFDRDSPLGRVRLYFAEFRDAVGDVSESGPGNSAPSDLDTDLNSSLDALFGPQN